MRRIVLVLGFLGLLIGCGSGSSESKAPVQRFQIHGVVQRLDAETHMATIKHQEIKGFMEAMTMEFPIRDAGAFSRLRKGETIDGTVFVQDTEIWVGEIQEAKQGTTRRDEPVPPVLLFLQIA